MLQELVKWTADINAAVMRLPWDKVGTTILLVILFGLFMEKEPSK